MYSSIGRIFALTTFFRSINPAVFRCRDISRDVTFSAKSLLTCTFPMSKMPTQNRPAPKGSAANTTLTVAVLVLNC